MSTRGDILRRAAQVEPGAVPEPWRPSDDEDALATVSDREHYRKNLVTLPDGAGEVPAYVWDFPRTPTIPDEVREEWTRSSAGRVLNAQGQFVSRGSDVPRKSFDGEEPGLLVEAAGRTNAVINSSDLNQWRAINATLRSSVSSILDGETAYSASASSSTNRFDKRAGTTTTSNEIYYVIVEKDTADKTALAVRDSTQGKGINGIRVSYDFSQDSFSTVREDFGTLQSTNSREIATSGPNGGSVRLLQMRYTMDQSGGDRDVLWHPDYTGSGDGTYFHHAQIEEAPNASSPIVTQGSPVTRSADDYAIFSGGQPSWWNPNEGTFFVTVRPLIYKLSHEHDIIVKNNNNAPQWISIHTEKSVRVFDGDNLIETQNNVITSFDKNKIAVSANSSKIRISANGGSVTTSHNGNLLSMSGISIGGTSTLSALINKIIYLPRALPESTLNRITS